MILLIVAASYTLFIQYGSTPEKIAKEDKPQVSNEDAKKEKPLNIPDSGRDIVCDRRRGEHRSV